MSKRKLCLTNIYCEKKICEIKRSYSENREQKLSLTNFSNKLEIPELNWTIIKKALHF